MRAGAGCVGCVRVCVLVVSGFSTRISHTYGIGLDRIGILTSSWYVRTVRDVRYRLRELLVLYRLLARVAIVC